MNAAQKPARSPAWPPPNRRDVIRAMSQVERAKSRMKGSRTITEAWLPERLMAAWVSHQAIGG